MNHCTSAAKNYITSPSNKHTFFQYTHSTNITTHRPSKHSYWISWKRPSERRLKILFFKFLFLCHGDSIDRKSIADHPKVITFQKTSSALNRINNSRLNSLIRNLSEIYRKLTSFSMGINCWISHESSEF